jgi:hypothetical protein
LEEVREKVCKEYYVAAVKKVVEIWRGLWEMLHWAQEESGIMVDNPQERGV